jgi:hypothetical protein
MLEEDFRRRIQDPLACAASLRRTVARPVRTAGKLRESFHDVMSIDYGYPIVNWSRTLRR